MSDFSEGLRLPGWRLACLFFVAYHRLPGIAARLPHRGVAVAREAAIDAAKRVIRSYPDFPLTYRWLAAALGQLGRTAEAKEALEKAIAVAPAGFDMYIRSRAPWHRPEDHIHLLEGLRKAGWNG
jgi:tetratricopeptide (TPR) repeat protein